MAWENRPPARFARTVKDAALKALVTELGVGRWADLARKMGTVRTGKQCRERWHNHLSPAVDKNEWREEEDHIIAEGVARLGPKCASAPEVGAGCTFITPLVIAHHGFKSVCARAAHRV